MRKGYAIKQLSPIKARLACPDDGTIADVHTLNGGGYFIENQFPVAAPQKISESDRVKVLGAIAEKHYQMMTTRHQKFRDRLNECVDYPVVKLVVLVASVIAAVFSVWR